MSDSPRDASVDSPGKLRGPAAKNKECPYCGQKFTSSSLGRHLDLFIKAVNPKAPDGKHDVEAIRRERSNITRRHARLRGQSGTPARTPRTAGSRRSVAPSDGGNSSTVASPTQGKASLAVNREHYPFAQPGWQQTGVINNIPFEGSNTRVGGDGDPDSHSVRGRSPQQTRDRLVSRQAQKTQLDLKQKLQDAQDTSRAAELALKELLSSWRAAKVLIDMTSMPFDFDPLSLDFPALTLRCLKPPPTIFSSTPVPTADSWSIAPPGQQQYDALCNYFTAEFQKWRVACASATTVVHDVDYPPSHAALIEDRREAVLRAEKQGEQLQAQLDQHLQAVYQAWNDVPPQRQQETWLLEMARNVSTKQNQIDTLNDTQQKLRQEVENLKAQISTFNRLQHPREFGIMPPETFPTSKKFIDFMMENGVVHGWQSLGFDMEGRHEDIEPLVAAAIERWKTVVVSKRVQDNGLNGQRSLDQPVLAGTVHQNGSTTSASSVPDVNGEESSAMPVDEHESAPRSNGVDTVTAVGGPSAASATDGTPMDNDPKDAHGSHNEMKVETTEDVEDDDGENEDEDDSNGQEDADSMSISDRDADAEMEDDDYPAVTAPQPAMPSQTNGQLNVQRVRASDDQQALRQQWAQRNFTHTGHGGRSGMNFTKDMPMPPRRANPSQVFGTEGTDGF